MLLGARDLGLRTEWRFSFVPFGFHAETTPGAVYLDVGGGLKPGVLDHHADPGAESSASLVLAHREAVYNHLLGPWLERFPEGRVPDGTAWRPTIVTHADPDWDGMTAAWLVMRLVEDGDFPVWAPALASYSLEVDQGRCRIIPGEKSSVMAPHIGYLALQNIVLAGKKLSNEECLQKGFCLLEAAIAGIDRATSPGPRSKDDFLPPKPGAAAWADLPEFAEIRAFLEDDNRKFEEDRKHRSREYLTIALPDRAGGSPIHVPAWVARRPTASALNKYWVRAEGTPLFVCPYVAKGHTGDLPEGPNAVFPRVVVSVDPLWKTENDDRRPDLRGLGYALEKAEAEKRRADGTSAERSGPPRFPDGYCDNKDPWYDGRGQEWTIVDAPACGSHLKYGELLDILAKTAFWETPLDLADVTLIWAGASDARGDVAPTAVTPFQGMSQTLCTYLAGTIDTPAGVPGPESTGPYRVEARIRRFPEGTCPPVKVVTIRAAAGATMEGLLDEHRKLVATMERPPDYAYNRVKFALHFGGTEGRDALLRPLTGGEARALQGVESGEDVVLFNGRALLVHLTSVEEDARAARADLEILLYAAFLNETLIEFSEELSRQLGDGEEALSGVDTGGLQTRMLSFQTRHYQLEVSRLPRGRALFARIHEELRLSDNYAEVQAELDRLAAVEANQAAQRADRASRVLAYFLAIVAVAGMFQTVIAFFTLDAAIRKTPFFWGSISTVGLLSVAVLVGVNLYRRKKRNTPSVRDGRERSRT